MGLVSDLEALLVGMTVERKAVEKAEMMGSTDLMMVEQKAGEMVV